ncbi:MAG: hypothetical protein M1416_01760 [Candidatus Pacearchaeota archaeon]|nr:hypothetical protein [Candidatus Pacearchaeota archaeon]
MKKEFMSNNYGENIDYPEIVGLYIDSHIFGKDFYDSVQETLTLEGKVVIRLDHELFDEFDKKKKEKMEELSYKKIDLIDTLQVETIPMHKNEKRDKFVEYAKQNGKEVIIR